MVLAMFIILSVNKGFTVIDRSYDNLNWFDRNLVNGKRLFDTHVLEPFTKYASIV